MPSKLRTPKATNSTAYTTQAISNLSVFFTQLDPMTKSGYVVVTFLLRSGVLRCQCVCVCVCYRVHGTQRLLELTGPRACHLRYTMCVTQVC